MLPIINNEKESFISLVHYQSPPGITIKTLVHVCYLVQKYIKSLDQYNLHVCRYVQDM